MSTARLRARRALPVPSRLALTALVAFGAVAFTPPPAVPPVALGIDFRQASNNSRSLGEIKWINSILQQSNSIYAEGMSVPQRLALVDIPRTADDHHVLLFSHQVTKGGGVHAYDFLTSWEQAVEAAKGKGPGGADLLDELFVSVCGPAIGPQLTAPACESLFGPTSVVATAALPVLSSPSSGGGTNDVGAQIAQYEAYMDALGLPRELTLRVPAGETVANAVVVFLGYTGGSDEYAEYALEWDSSSSLVAIEFAGHLAAGGSDGIVPGYGDGFGASSISGGPYHFKLDELDGASLGSQDNQIKGADVIVPPPPCDVSGPPVTCPGEFLLYSDSEPFDPSITYEWTFLDNTSGASFLSPTDEPEVVVDSGTTGGMFTVQLQKTGVGGTTLCPFSVVVHENTTATDPDDVTACEGTDVTFATTASGAGPLTYAWTKTGSATVLSTTSSLTILSVQPGDEGEYCVEVTGACNTATQCADLTVLETTTTTGLPDEVACTGDDVTFVTLASGTGPFMYAWTKTGSGTILSTTSSLTILNVQPSDEGEYCVVVTGDCGAPALECGSLTVDQSTMASDPGDKTVCPGENVTFTTTASGAGAITYAWTKTGSATVLSTTSSLTILNVQPGDAGEYCVEVMGACNTVTQCADLTVGETTVATHPDDVTACEGEDVLFCTTASGPGPFSYQWSKDGSDLTGATDSCLSLTSVGLSNAGEYCVEVSGACNSTVACATLAVEPLTTITDPPDSQTKCEGESVVFSVTATNATGYQWSKDGFGIDGATNSSLSIASVAPSDAGEYCVLVSGVCNSPEACATLTVDETTITTDLPDASVCPGENVTFTIVASGPGPFAYAWTKSGDAVVLSTTSSLTLHDVQSTDAGEYCVEVTGPCNPVTKCADLDVLVCDEIFCTFTQGFWGNAGGKFNGLTTPELLQDLMTPDDLVVGKPGLRSLTIPSTSWECVIERLPAGGKPKPLPDFGDQVMNQAPICFVPLVLKNGKFHNVLLGQTIALSLNVRLDDGLSDLELCNVMTTALVAPGPDGILGTGDDVPDPGPDGVFGTDDDTLTVLIPPDLLLALDALYGSHDVASLLELANCALAGEFTGGVSLSSINRAVDAVNRGFDGCRLLVACESL